ncbi:YceI family protein [Vibrio mediterranei]|uniref:YceI family protein n=1 Tax=Vibrio mediterranei TaxID=689 RepID=UPI00148D0C8D|nr:YceI family protein [Vibrio mediterranei]NOH31726.1 YceI family protein [Vibrio mediterranei]
MTKKIQFISFLVMLFSMNALSANDYTLDTDLSSVSFATIKKQFIVEPANISKLSGNLDKNGHFDITIDVRSIDTGVKVRDSRLNEFLFKSSIHPKVKVRGKVDLANFKDGSYRMVVPVDVEFWGHTRSLEFPVVILKSNDYLMVSSSTPLILGISDIGIPNRNLSDLASKVGEIPISSKVPVTINLMFKK